MAKLVLLGLLGGVVMIGAGVLSYLYEGFYNQIIQLQPPTYIYGVFGAVLATYSAFQFYKAGWEEAKPNEWLVIVQNGKQIKAGVGLICFRQFYQTAIKFPSAVQKVQFNAMQVCEEMQGLRIQGFAVWSVHRDQPFLFYKQMHGANANQSIQQVCESVVRHEIANSTLDTVITKREVLRDKMRDQLQKILTGWGVWLETVEITEVTICSNQLFEDMQAPNKQENYLKSEKYKLKVNTEMAIDKEQSNQIIEDQKITKETERLEYYYQQEIKKAKQESEYKKKNIEIMKNQEKQESEFEQEQIKRDHAIAKQNLLNEQQIQRETNEAQRKEVARKIKAEQEMSETNLEKYRLEQQYEIMQNIKLQNINVHSYGGNKEGNTFSSLIPKLSGKQIKQ